MGQQDNLEDRSTYLAEIGQRLGEAAFRRAAGYLAEMEGWGLDPSAVPHRREFVVLDLYAVRAGMSGRTSAARIDLVLNAAARACGESFSAMTGESAMEFENYLDMRHRQYDELCDEGAGSDESVREAVDVFVRAVSIAAGSRVDSLRGWLQRVVVLLTSSGIVLGDQIEAERG